MGYEGGTVSNPTYEQVCSHTTGHAETVQVEYDSAKVSYEQLLNLFFEHHDPTQLNRQGPDVGDSYRSVIFYHNDMQKKLAEDKITELTKVKKFKKSNCYPSSTCQNLLAGRRVPPAILA